MILLGLTGSIAMGKSTTAAMFRAEGVPVYDADTAVHEAYGIGGLAVASVGALVPQAVVGGGIDRSVLRGAIAAEPALLPKIEAVVHPIVANMREDFIKAATADGAPLVVLDIPLLFETGGDGRVDRIVVVTAPLEMQRSRALARPGMTAERLDAILARQLPDAEKRARADYVIDTGKGMDAAQGQVREIIAELMGKGG